MIFVTNDDVMGKNIRYLRCKNGITQDVLAKQSGITLQELWWIEDGSLQEIDGQILFNICQFFNIPVDVLVEKKLY